MGLGKILKQIGKVMPYDAVYYACKMPVLKFNEIDDIRPYFYQAGMRNYNKKFENSKNSQYKIIIYGLRTQSLSYLAVFEKVLSDALKFNGASVKNLLCENYLKSCDAAILGESHKKICKTCRKQGKRFKKQFPNEFLSFSQFISDDEKKSIEYTVEEIDHAELIGYTYMGVHVGQHAFNSSNKYFRHGNFDSTSEEFINCMKHNIVQGMITVKIAENLVKKENPTHFITIHGGYSSWGPIADYLKNAGVEVYRYIKSVNKIGDIYITKLGEDLSGIVAEDVWEKSKQTQLEPEKRRKLSTFLNKKREGNTLDYQLYNESKKQYKDEQLIKLLNSDDKEKFALYPHVLWDKGYLNRYDSQGSFFKDDIEWMLETIKFFIGLDDSLLFIKPHPGERLKDDWTTYSSTQVIKDHFGELPNHIILINNDYPITSFNLMQQNCIGLVFSSTAGLEYSYFKKPVLVAANIHYKYANAVLPVNSKEEYYDIIKTPQPLFDFVDNNFDIIEKYAYHFYYMQQVSMPFFRKDLFLGHCVDWSVIEKYEEFIEKDEVMNHIARSIINGEHVVSIR